MSEYARQLTPEEARELFTPKNPNKDNINKPDHYHRGNIDVIGFSELQFDAAELRGFYRINAIKYLTRFDKKGSAVEDLKKSQFYINKLIEMEESNND